MKLFPPKKTYKLLRETQEEKLKAKKLINVADQPAQNRYLSLIKYIKKRLFLCERITNSGESREGSITDASGMPEQLHHSIVPVLS